MKKATAFFVIENRYFGNILGLVWNWTIHFGKKLDYD